MILHLDDRRFVSVEAHSGNVWLKSYNGTGTINPMTRGQAIRLRAELLAAILKLEASEQVK